MMEVTSNEEVAGIPILYAVALQVRSVELADRSDQLQSLC